MVIKHMFASPSKIPTPFDIAMMLLSVIAMTVVLFIFFAPLENETKRLLTSIDTLICCIFIVHFSFNFIVTQDKTLYFKQHWPELLASIPLVEPLRLLRFLQIFRVIKMIALAQSVLLPILKQRIQTTLAGLLVFMVVIVCGSALAIFLIESNAPNSNIKTAADALWWGLITISTVGYGDYYPVTPLGRLISSLLIISGVSLFGVISGYIASIFAKETQLGKEKPEWIHDLTHTQHQQHMQLMSEIQKLKRQIDELKQQK